MSDTGMLHDGQVIFPPGHDPMTCSCDKCIGYLRWRNQETLRIGAVPGINSRKLRQRGYLCIPDELDHQFRTVCRIRGLKFTEGAREALVLWVENNSKGSTP